MAKRLGWYLPQELTLKITLMGSEPPIWRRIAIDSGLALDELHDVIQAVFDWEDCHLHHYIVPPEGKLTQKAMGDATYYSKHPEMPGPMGPDDGPEDKTMVGHVLNKTCKHIIYEYDFGDGWNHLIKLEKVRDGAPEKPAICLAGENAAPRDDMGGIHGYYMYLEEIQKGDSEEADWGREILGKNFDPAKFDLDAVNKRLAKLFRPVPKKPRKKKSK